MVGKVKRIRATGEGHIHFNIEKDAKTYIVMKDVATFGNVFALLQLAVERGMRVEVINDEFDGMYWATGDIALT